RPALPAAHPGNRGKRSRPRSRQGIDGAGLTRRYRDAPPAYGSAAYAPGRRPPVAPDPGPAFGQPRPAGQDDHTRACGADRPPARGPALISLLREITFGKCGGPAEHRLRVKSTADWNLPGSWNAVAPRSGTTECQYRRRRGRGMEISSRPARDI